MYPYRQTIGAASAFCKSLLITTNNGATIRADSGPIYIINLLDYYRS